RECVSILRRSVGVPAPVAAIDVVVIPTLKVPSVAEVEVVVAAATAAPKKKRDLWCYFALQRDFFISVSIQMAPKYWIGVVSQPHVEFGVSGGFCQMHHGKVAALYRMKVGDGLIYYSPKTDMDPKKGKPLQSFTAIGSIIGEKPYQFAMNENSTPFRLSVAYEPNVKAVSIRPLLDKLDFVRKIKNPAKWGMLFRAGHFEIGKNDFDLISAAMGAGGPVENVSTENNTFTIKQ
ncbi:hypothetical protein HK100_010606, partial [Physocladia obscura]